jgi:hypothetical protein
LIIIHFKKNNMGKIKVFAVVLLLLVAGNCPAQDYIITWNNDTLYCELPANPSKAGFRPRLDNKNGYFKLAAIFPNDSVRVFKPGEIKGYYRAKHGRGLLCDGMFYSVQSVRPNRPLTDADGKKSGGDWYFMLADEVGEYASMYKVMELNKRLNSYYYVIKHGGSKKPEGVFMGTKKHITAILAEKDIEEPMTGFIKKNRLFGKMINEYNRLKKEAEVARP